jgi:hypothetical protein
VKLNKKRYLTRGKYEGYEKNTEFVFENMMADHLGDLGADKKVILKFIILKWHGIVKLIQWWVILTQ